MAENAATYGYKTSTNIYIEMIYQANYLLCGELIAFA